MTDSKLSQEHFHAAWAVLRINNPEWWGTEYAWSCYRANVLSNNIIERVMDTARKLNLISPPPAEAENTPSFCGLYAATFEELRDLLNVQPFEPIEGYIVLRGMDRRSYVFTTTDGNDVWCENGSENGRVPVSAANFQTLFGERLNIIVYSDHPAFHRAQTLLTQRGDATVKAENTDTTTVRVKAATTFGRLPLMTEAEFRKRCTGEQTLIDVLCTRFRDAGFFATEDAQAENAEPSMADLGARIEKLEREQRAHMEVLTVMTATMKSMANAINRLTQDTP